MSKTKDQSVQKDLIEWVKAEREMITSMRTEALVKENELNTVIKQLLEAIKMPDETVLIADADTTHELHVDRNSSTVVPMRRRGRISADTTRCSDCKRPLPGPHALGCRRVPDGAARSAKIPEALKTPRVYTKPHGAAGPLASNVRGKCPVCRGVVTGQGCRNIRKAHGRISVMRRWKRPVPANVKREVNDVLRAHGRDLVA